MKNFINIFKSAIIAGGVIGIGGYVYLTIGGLAGAILFAFGLLTVVHYGLFLYTGKGGYICTIGEFFILITSVLFGNVIGCYLMSLISTSQVIDESIKIVNGRISAGYFTNFLLAIPCGFIMTTAVEFAKKDKYLPLLFGVPTFILCGFRHSIADAFYYCCAGIYTEQLLYIWLLIVLGNFIGCNLYRLINYKL